MMPGEQLKDIYSHLPVSAQQEAMDFLVFLKQRYSQKESAVSKEKSPEKPVSAIHNHPAFGMWADQDDDSCKILDKIRKQQWPRS